MMRLPINIKQDKSTCQELKLNSTSNQQIQNKTALQTGQKVFLYGDLNYTGTLIHPVERTYPPRWTIQLDRGGYEAVNINNISPIESRSEKRFIRDKSNRSSPNPDIPFSDEIEEPETNISQLEQEIAALRRENAALKQENQIIAQQYRELERENELLKKDLDQAKQIIRRAKDISPLMRISLKRVLRLAHDACMDVQRTVGGWILRMGNKARKFRRLADIWDLLSVDEFLLSDIFPEDKLIAVELILPPRKRKKPQPPEKKTFPLIRPEEVLRRRRMGMPKC